MVFLKHKVLKILKKCCGRPTTSNQGPGCNCTQMNCALRGNKKKLFPTSMYFKKSTPFSLLFYEYKLRVFSWKKILLSQGEKYKLKLQNLAFRNNFYFVLKADLLKLSIYFFLRINLSLCFFNFDSKYK